MRLLVAIDESYGSNGRFLVLGGYVGTYPAWEMFYVEWRAFLQSHGVGGFHATDVRSGSGLFASMRHLQRVEFIEKAERIANRHLLFRFFTAIDTEDYKRHYSNGLTGVRRESAYGMCFRATISSLIRFVEHVSGSPPSPLDFLIEEGHRNAGDLKRVFDEFRRSVRPPLVDSLGTLGFAGKSDVRLHAADAMAYAGWRDMETNGADWATAAKAADDPIDPDDPCPVMRAMVTVPTLTEYRERILKARDARKAFGRARRTIVPEET